MNGFDVFKFALLDIFDLVEGCCTGRAFVAVVVVEGFTDETLLA